jgi:hypothetical protein
MQSKTRNFVAIAAHQRNSAGTMEKGKRGKRKADRKNAKQAIRKGDW